MRNLARQYGVPPDCLELEITEGVLVNDPTEAVRVLREIAAIGLRVIAIDDFGTGYSSLARLHELPLDTLKIDQSFVKRMGARGDDTIVRSVVDLAHALGLDVIAEGVEDGDVAERLARLGCEYLQGYHVSRPLPAAGLEEWLFEGPGVPFVPGNADQQVGK
jgi:EAL domain-containing protein (putative c-di-GMP-specific phosphodiesterase class I)